MNRRRKPLKQRMKLLSLNKPHRAKNKRHGKPKPWGGMAGFVLLCLAVLTGLSLTSNLINPADNILGQYFGQYLSRILVGFAGKIPALLFPWLLMTAGWHLITRHESARTYRQVFFAGAAFVELCIILSIKNLSLGRSWEQFYNSGGLLGNFIVQNMLGPIFGSQRVGAFIVVLFVTGGTLVWGLRIDIHDTALKLRLLFLNALQYALLAFRQVRLAYSGAYDHGSGATMTQERPFRARRARKQFENAENIIVVSPGTLNPAESPGIDEGAGGEPAEKLTVKELLDERYEQRQREFWDKADAPVIKELTPEEIAAEEAKRDIERAADTQEEPRRGRRPSKKTVETGPLPLEDNAEAALEDRASELPPSSETIPGEIAPERAVEEGEVPAVEPEVEPVEEVHYDEYVMPALELLEDRKSQGAPITPEQMQANARILEEKLKDFKIIGKIMEICPGPVVTRYELELSPGTKVSKVEGLSVDLAVAMAVEKIRISIVPGKSAIGIELPNPNRQTVYIKEVLQSSEYQKGELQIPLVLGKDIAGRPNVVDLVKMPHLLIAGTTGSGKSVCTNSFIASILLARKPEELKFILIDPKVVEMSIYNGIPHLLSDVITTPKEAVNALKWASAEMERRYQLLAKATCRNIAQFNAKSGAGAFEESALDEKDRRHMPYIVIIIDELADLIINIGKELEEEIVRIAQKARAVGIHLILATQRPEAKVVTGLIKSNLPSRIALTVSSATDSRIIIDDKGAEELLGMGDMLFKSVDMSQMRRIHGTFIETSESEKIILFAKNQNVRREKIKSFEQAQKKTAISLGGSYNNEMGELMEAAKIIVMRQQGSTSLLQRKMSVGYSKAGRLMDQLEEIGVVGPNLGSKAREVLVENEAYLDVLFQEYADQIKG